MFCFVFKQKLKNLKINKKKIKWKMRTEMKKTCFLNPSLYVQNLPNRLIVHYCGIDFVKFRYWINDFVLNGWLNKPNER